MELEKEIQTIDDLIGQMVEVEFDDEEIVIFEIVDIFDFNGKAYAFLMELEDEEDLENSDDEDGIEGNGYLMIVNPDFTLQAIEEDGEFFQAVEYYQSVIEETLEIDDEDLLN